MLTTHRTSLGVSPRRVVGALLALGLALLVPHAPWFNAPRAESDRAAISRSGVLGGASYLIEAPAKWDGGLVVFAVLLLAWFRRAGYV